MLLYPISRSPPVAPVRFRDLRPGRSPRRATSLHPSPPSGATRAGRPVSAVRRTPAAPLGHFPLRSNAQRRRSRLLLLTAARSRPPVRSRSVSSGEVTTRVARISTRGAERALGPVRQLRLTQRCRHDAAGARGLFLPALERRSACRKSGHAQSVSRGRSGSPTRASCGSRATHGTNVKLTRFLDMRSHQLPRRPACTFAARPITSSTFRQPDASASPKV